MKELFLMLQDAILSHFDGNNDYKIHNVLIENSQLNRMEVMNQFNFPSAFFSYNNLNWFTVQNGIRYASPEFTINLVIESYESMEESIFIEEYATSLKNFVLKLNKVTNDFHISTPWLISETKGENESNLMSLQLNFQVNVTDFTNRPKTTATLTDTIINANIGDDTSNWILSNGTWHDNKIWIDSEVWQD